MHEREKYTFHRTRGGIQTMIILPVSGLLVMPDVTYYFQNDYIGKYMQGAPAEGAEVLFLLMKK